MGTDATPYHELFGDHMTVEDLARQFYEHRGRMTAEIEGLKRDLARVDNDVNNLSRMLRAARNGTYAKMAGVGFGGGAGAALVVDTVLRWLGGN